MALTGFARDVERERFLDGGFQAVVVKPILDYGELTAVIDGLVNSPAPAAPRTSSTRAGAVPHRPHRQPRPALTVEYR